MHNTIKLFILTLVLLTRFIYAGTIEYPDIAGQVSRIKEGNPKDISEEKIWNVNILISKYIRESDNNDFREPSQERLLRLKQIHSLFDEKAVLSLMTYANSDKNGAKSAIYFLRYAPASSNLQEKLEAFTLNRENYWAIDASTRILKTKGMLTDDMADSLTQELFKLKNLDEDPYITKCLGCSEYWASPKSVPALEHLISDFKPRYNLERLFIFGMAAEAVPTIGGEASLPLLPYFESALKDPTYIASKEKNSLDAISVAVDYIKNKKPPDPIYGLDGGGYLDRLAAVESSAPEPQPSTAISAPEISQPRSVKSERFPWGATGLIILFLVLFLIALKYKKSK
jgi:hypothetical protein